MTSIFGMLGVDLTAPDHTTLSRRGQHLALALRRARPGTSLHLIVDSTGLSIVGEGEWAAAKHGGRGRRGWRKLHLGVDGSRVIVACALTEPTADDAITGISLVDEVDGHLTRVTADPAYDTLAFYGAAGARGARVVVPPTKTASLSRRGARSGARDRTIRRVKALGRRRWKKASGDHQQARVEHAFFRYTSIVGDCLRARSSSGQCLGAQLAISVNNCPPPRDPRSRMTSFKRTQRKYVQKAYRVRNWREYETGLRARGSLTVWLGLTDGKLANWNSPRPTRRKPGRQRKYSNHAIETTVTLGLVFGLASRQTEGFLRSLLTLLNLDNDVPDHSTISRRKARLGKGASYERRTVKPVHLLIDSSGLSVHVGQLRTPPKARDYRKLHLAVDEHTSDVVACELTSKRARDASRVASLVGQIERPIASAKADAAYDTGDV